MNKIVSKNLFKLLIITASLIVASYAWFYKGTSVNTNFESKVNATNTIEVSLDNGDTWNNSTDLSIFTNIVFNNEVTGNGINMYVASLKDTNGNPIAFSNAIANEDYLEFTIMFKTTLPTKIFLEANSSVTPTTTGNLIGSDVVRKSRDGDFSRDIIAGAVRVAFIENDYSQGRYTPQNTAKLVWAPNKNYEIIEDEEQYNVNLNSNNSQTYQYLKALTRYTYETANVDNLYDEIKASYNTKFTYDDPALLTVLENEPVYKSLTVRIWVEGNDRETISPLLGGMFDIKLGFVGIDKEENTNELNVTKSGNTLIGFDDSMEYSYDNKTWYTDLTTFNSTIYVRYKETEEKFASEPIEIIF